MTISFDNFKNDMVRLYENDKTIIVSIDKVQLSAVIKVEFIFTDDSGDTLQISDDNDTSIIFNNNNIISIEKSSDGIGEYYDICQNDITMIVSIL